MKLCDYGCGQEAKHYFKTVNKWCCSDHWSKCPEKRKRYAGKNNPMYGKDSWNKGKINIYSEEVLEKMRKNKSTKGKTYEEIYGVEKASELKKLRSKHFSKIRKGKETWNKGLTKETNNIIKKQAEKLSEIKRYTIENYKEKYPTFVAEEKPIIENGKIKVRCKYCNNWFYPTKNQLRERIRKFDRSFETTGNSYFYCSEFCKNNSDVFNLKVDPEQLTRFKKYSREVWILTRKTVQKYPEKIKNLNLRGRKYGYDLDHKYSVYEGFCNNTDPILIAHYNNLEILPTIVNIQKKTHSSISLKTLIEITK